jgi:hypothetical protein
MSVCADVIGYFAFWTCVFVLQFLNYLDDAKYDRVGFTNVSFRVDVQCSAG